MLATIPAQSLARALKSVQPTSRRCSLPCLDGRARISVALDGQVRVEATDLYTSTREQIQSADGAAPGAVVVAIKPALASLAKRKGNVTISTERPGQLQLAFDGAVASIPSTDGEDPDAWPVGAPRYEIGRYTLDACALRAVLARTIPTMSDDDTRPHLAGVQLELDGEGDGCAVSTDGHRLTLTGTVLASPSLATIVPAAAAHAIARAMRHARPGTECTLATLGSAESAAPSAYRIDCEGSRVQWQRVDEQFPPYVKVIPRAHAWQAVLDTATLRAAVASAIASPKSGGLRLAVVADGTVTIHGEDPDAGSSRAVVQAVTTWTAPDTLGGLDAATVGINRGYLLDAIDACADDSGRTILRGADGLDPIVVTGPAALALAVVMPMRT